VVCTGAGDEIEENLLRIWEVVSKGTKKKVMSVVVGDELGGGTTKEGILSLR
jgi:hypothetical protein